MNESELKVLKLLSEKYPNIQSASTEIINLNAICHLPKATEHFLSDIHGEKVAFFHIMNNCSGVIKEKIDALFEKSMTKDKRAILATLIYYPKEKLKEIESSLSSINDWYKVTLYELIDVCRSCASKYSRSKVRKSLPKGFEWSIDELLHPSIQGDNHEQYYETIIDSIIELGEADSFIVALSDTIKRLAVDKLHIVGDIYDRGPHPDDIMDLLLTHHSVDIQWGNHDIVWMGAGAGSSACIASVLNTSITYRNTEALESGYGISLRPLANFAKSTYKSAECFMAKGEKNDENELELALMKKAIFIILFKLEGQLIKRNPQYEMEDRLMLDKIDYEKGTITLKNNTYKLKDCDFPTIDPKNPYNLTMGEQILISKLKNAFLRSEKLQKHISFLYSVGGMYLVYNNNLLYHGCVPLDKDGNFLKVKTSKGIKYGKDFYDYCDNKARTAFYAPYGSDEKNNALDFMWYLWCGKSSPLFGKDKMATFERLLIDDPETHVENKNPYYKYYNSYDTFRKIADEFNLRQDFSHIINGHVPVKSKNGESPIKADGRLIVIDGGFCKAYQTETGIAGYTLIFNSYGLRLAAHTPFNDKEQAIKENLDVHSQVNVLDKALKRITVGETDVGQSLKSTILDLNKLVDAYRNGVIKEKNI